MCFLADEDKVCLSGVVLEEVLECGADGAFVFFAELCVFFEFGVVCFNGFVCGFDVEFGHGVSGCQSWSSFSLDGAGLLLCSIYGVTGRCKGNLTRTIYSKV